MLAKNLVGTRYRCNFALAFGKIATEVAPRC